MNISRKYRTRYLFALVYILLLVGCAKSKPVGIITYNSHTCYALKIPENKSVTDYFTLTGGGQTAILDASTGEMRVVNYSAIMEGGWIVYQRNWVMYVPPEYDGKIKYVCSALPEDSSGYMSLDEAKSYLPWLTEKNTD